LLTITHCSIKYKNFIFVAHSQNFRKSIIQSIIEIAK
jgi:hypothetical protein